MIQYWYWKYFDDGVYDGNDNYSKDVYFSDEGEKIGLRQWIWTMRRKIRLKLKAIKYVP